MNDVAKEKVEKVESIVENNLYSDVYWTNVVIQCSCKEKSYLKYGEGWYYEKSSLSNLFNNRRCNCV